MLPIKLKDRRFIRPPTSTGETNPSICTTKDDSTSCHHTSRVRPKKLRRKPKARPAITDIEARTQRLNLVLGAGLWLINMWIINWCMCKSIPSNIQIHRHYTNSLVHSLRCPRLPRSPQQACQTIIPGSRQCGKDYAPSHAESMLNPSNIDSGHTTNLAWEERAVQEER